MEMVTIPSSPLHHTPPIYHNILTHPLRTATVLSLIPFAQKHDTNVLLLLLGKYLHIFHICATSCFIVFQANSRQICLHVYLWEILTTSDFIDCCAVILAQWTVFQMKILVQAVVKAGDVGCWAGFIHMIEAATLQTLTDLFKQPYCRVFSQCHYTMALVSRDPEHETAFTIEFVNVWVICRHMGRKTKLFNVMLVPLKPKHTIVIFSAIPLKSPWMRVSFAYETWKIFLISISFLWHSQACLIPKITVQCRHQSLKLLTSWVTLTSLG